MMQPIKLLSKTDIEKLLKENGQPKFRVKQLLEWLYVHEARSYDEMTNLPAALRTMLASQAPLIPLETADVQRSADGTRKYLFRLHDGCLVETVAIPSFGSSDHLTVCFSTQVGCPMACAFCATGKQGFTRNLGMGEIVDQVLAAQNDMGTRVSNLVAMGQGEPFLNYEAVADALHVLNDPKGIAIGARKITVSTCGILPGIARFAQEPYQFTLAVSLHSARQSTRDALMPAVAKYTLPNLRSTLEDYIQKTNRRVTFEYIMIDGVNDTEEELQALMRFTRGLLCHVNLLKANDIDGSPFKPSSTETITRWIAALESTGIQATLRNSRGQDIQGACGQLANSFSRASNTR